MSREQVMNTINELNNLYNTKEMQGGGRKIRAKYPYGYGGGLVAEPSQFGYGRNIAGCNMYGMGGYSNVGGVSAQQKRLRSALSAASKQANTLLEQEAQVQGYKGKTKTTYKLQQLLANRFSPEVTEHLYNKIENGRIQGQKYGHLMAAAKADPALRQALAQKRALCKAQYQQCMNRMVPGYEGLYPPGAFLAHPPILDPIAIDIPTY